MDRREFIKLSALGSLLVSFPCIALEKTQLVVHSSGGDDTDAINAALRASARIGDPVALAKGYFRVTGTIVVPAGARLIGQGRLSSVSFDGRKVGEVIQIEEPHADCSVKCLYVEDRYSPVPFTAIIG